MNSGFTDWNHSVGNIPSLSARKFSHDGSVRSVYESPKSAIDPADCSNAAQKKTTNTAMMQITAMRLFSW